MSAFYLGTHHPHWLERVDVPLFVSRRQLEKRRRLPRARAPWALDSGGFTELSLFGEWTMTAHQYAALVARFVDEIGRLEWAAPQDWMCEPWILAKTGLTVREHQRRTVENLIELRELAPELPWVPVLQGWALDDYLWHVDMYDAAGVDLSRETLVGLGSVCRRQGTQEIAALVRRLAGLGLRLHGFGMKTRGLMAAASHLVSADSLAWSYEARRRPPLPGHRHKNCANCLEYALLWRKRVLNAVRSAKRLPVQRELFEFGGTAA